MVCRATLIFLSVLVWSRLQSIRSGSSAFAQGARPQGFKPTCLGSGTKDWEDLLLLSAWDPRHWFCQVFRSFSYTSLCISVSTSEYHFRTFKGGSITFKYGIPVIQRFLLFNALQKKKKKITLEAQTCHVQWGACIGLCDSARWDSLCQSQWGSGTTASVSPGSWLEMQTCRPHLDLLNQNLHFNKLPIDSNVRCSLKSLETVYAHIPANLGTRPTKFQPAWACSTITSPRTWLCSGLWLLRGPLPTQSWEASLRGLAVSSSRLPFPALVIPAGCWAGVHEDVITCLAARCSWCPNPLGLPRPVSLHS